MNLCMRKINLCVNQAPTVTERAAFRPNFRATNGTNVRQPHVYFYRLRTLTTHSHTHTHIVCVYAFCIKVPICTQCVCVCVLNWFVCCYTLVGMCTCGSVTVCIGVYLDLYAHGP